MSITAQRSTDRRPAMALVFAIVAVAASLTFFWMYAIPPLVFAVPAVLIVRRVHMQYGALPRPALIAAALVPVALVCDLTFLIINIHHLY